MVFRVGMVGISYVAVLSDCFQDLGQGFSFLLLYFNNYIASISCINFVEWFLKPLKINSFSRTRHLFLFNFGQVVK